MQGFTIYLNEFNNLQYATKEQIGNMFLMAMDACENEIIPSFDNPMDAMLFDGFKRCLEKGFVRKKNGKNGGAPIGNQNAKKIKPNEGFDTTVSCYTPTQIVEKRSIDNEVDNNNLQLLLATLEETKPQTNQTINLLYWNNSKVRNCIDGNKINKATQEMAWNIYTSNSSID